MSRCFPYPPPGYIPSKEKNEALIELIKLQKEREKLKEKRREKIERRMEKKKKMMERKDRSKERKERSKEIKERKERKERSKEKKDEASQKVDKSDIVNCHERMDAETEQSPQSGLTEEHGHSDSVPVSSSSYDSTENNNKRKRHSSPTEDIHGHVEANPISLTSKWQSDFHTLAKGLQHTGDSGLRDAPENLCHASGETSSREEICLTSGETGNRSSLNAVSREVELQYKHLLESWFPPQLHDTGLYPVDLDWLYPDRRNQDSRRAEKRRRSGCDSTSCQTSTVWSCAKYLQEVDTFALPYVVPY